MRIESKMTKKKVLAEFLKFTFFSLASILVIYLLQKRYESLGSQFKLVDFDHDSSICPLYPRELGKLSSNRLQISRYLSDSSYFRRNFQR